MCVTSSPTARLKRLNELRACIRDPNDPNAFFQNFDSSLRNEPLKRKAFFDLEAELQLLDDGAWEQLKAEAIPRLSERHPTRGWEALFNILNQAKAYNFLKQRKYNDVQFIPRAKGKKTPDLKARDGASLVLCEAKTLNISKGEAERRTTGGVGTTVLLLPEGIFTKLRSDMDTALTQMRAYDAAGEVKMIFYCVVNFDSHSHEYADDHRPQLDACIRAHADPALEAVLDIRPSFHTARA